MQHKYIIKHFAIIFLASLLFFFQSSIFAISNGYIKKIDKINQQVSIRDIVVRTKPRHYGEYYPEQYTKYTYPENQRIIDHIQLLFSLANEDHKANYYVQDINGEFQLQDDKKNCITRLTIRYSPLSRQKKAFFKIQTTINI